MSNFLPPLKVAVTGNAQFWDFDCNTSMMVRDALPDVIQRPGKRNILILKYARDTEDTYVDVRKVSRDIFTGQRKLFLPAVIAEEAESPANIDFVVHLGMETREEQYAFETIARREGYERPGADGTGVDSEELKELGLPEVLKTGFDVETAWRKVKEAFPEPKITLSHDAGLYYCEFRLYSSPAELEMEHADKKGRVFFMHIPQAYDEPTIELGRDIAVAYISALADDPLLT